MIVKWVSRMHFMERNLYLMVTWKRWKSIGAGRFFLCKINCVLCCSHFNVLTSHAISTHNNRIAGVSVEVANGVSQGTRSLSLPLNDDMLQSHMMTIEDLIESSEVTNKTWSIAKSLWIHDSNFFFAQKWIERQIISC
jgi:hypothetical protein